MSRRPWLDLRVGLIRDVFHELEPESVDLIVTSPPYKDDDGFTLELMQDLGELAGKILKPSGRLYMNFGQLRTEGFTRPFDARACVEEWGKPYGLRPGQTIAWVKSAAVPCWRAEALERVKTILTKRPRGPTPTIALVWVLKALKELQAFLQSPGEVLQRGHYQPITMRSPTLNYCWEPVFTFFKPPERLLDRLSIGCAFADKTNLKRGTRGKHGDVHCIGDVWWIPYKTTGAKKKKATSDLEHSYQFPEELAERCIKVAGLEPGAVVCDPFMGSGRVAVVAKRLGFDVLGVECDKHAAQVTSESWKKTKVGHGRSGGGR